MGEAGQMGRAGLEGGIWGAHTFRKAASAEGCPSPVAIDPAARRSTAASTTRIRAAHIVSVSFSQDLCGNQSAGLRLGGASCHLQFELSKFAGSRGRGGRETA